MEEWIKASVEFSYQEQAPITAMFDLGVALNELSPDSNSEDERSKMIEGFVAKTTYGKQKHSRQDRLCNCSKRCACALRLCSMHRHISGQAAFASLLTRALLIRMSCRCCMANAREDEAVLELCLALGKAVRGNYIKSAKGKVHCIYTGGAAKSAHFIFKKYLKCTK